jgi:hypothetical protein
VGPLGQWHRRGGGAAAALGGPAGSEVVSGLGGCLRGLAAVVRLGRRASGLLLSAGSWAARRPKRVRCPAGLDAAERAG